MYLRPIDPEDLEMIRKERNELEAGILRTPYLLTRGMQRRWWEEQIDNRDSHTRYWMLNVPLTESNPYGYRVIDSFGVPTVGYGGLESIEWENGTAELSLLIFSKHRGNGYGKEAVQLFLEQAFLEMGLDTVYAEVYSCNPNAKFWPKHDHHHHTVLPRRKRLAGKLYDADIYYWYKERF